jgi:hypothetical protein
MLILSQHCFINNQSLCRPFKGKGGLKKRWFGTALFIELLKNGYGLENRVAQRL